MPDPSDNPAAPAARHAAEDAANTARASKACDARGNANGTFHETADGRDMFFYLTDALFSVRGLTAERSNTVVEWVDYTPYGEPNRSLAGDWDANGLADFFDTQAYLAAFDAGGDAADLAAPFGTIDFFDYLEFQAVYAEGTTADTATGLVPIEQAGLMLMNASSTSGLEADNQIGYAGYMRGDNGARAGLWHVRHRVLDPDSGRWTSRDPVGPVDGSLVYQYTSSQPVSLADPLGLFPVPFGPILPRPVLDAMRERQAQKDRAYKACEDPEVWSEFVGLKGYAEFLFRLNLWVRVELAARVKLAADGVATDEQGEFGLPVTKTGFHGVQWLHRQPERTLRALHGRPCRQRVRFKYGCSLTCSCAEGGPRQATGTQEWQITVELYGEARYGVQTIYRAPVMKRGRWIIMNLDCNTDQEIQETLLLLRRRAREHCGDGLSP